MAQRRYVDEQANRIAAGGEQAPSGNYTAWDPLTWARWKIGRAILPESWASAGERLDANIQSGIANSVLQLGQMPELASNLWNALDAESRREKGVPGGDTFSHAFYQSSVGGAQGEQELNDYLKKKTQEIVADRPPNEQNDPEVWKAASAAVQGSDEFKLLQQSKTGALNQASINAQDWISNKFGLPPQRQQTGLDEFEQIIGGALIPTPTKVTSLIEKAPGILRGAARVGEWLLPGSHGAGSAVVNAVAPEVVSQGLRRFGGAPSIAGGWSEYAGGVGQSQGGPATSSSTPVTTEAATAPVPFPAQSQPTVSEAGVTLPPSERDAQGGGSTSQWFGGLAILGAAATVAAAMRSKVPTGIATQIIRDVDSPNAAARLAPDTSDIALKPTLTTSQKIQVGAQKGRAIPLSAENALRSGGAPLDDPHVQQSINRIEREAADASRLEVSNAHNRAIVNGDIPHLERRTTPLAELYRFRDDNFTPEDDKLFQQYMAYSDRLSQFTAATTSLRNQVSDLNIKLRNANTPTQRYRITSKVAELEAQINRRQQPGAIVSNDLSIAEINAIKNTAEMNPKIKRLAEGLIKIRDDLYQSGVNAGQWSKEFADNMRAQRPHFVPMEMDPYAGMGRVQRTLKKLGELTKGRHEPGERMPWSTEMYSGKRGPVLGKRANEGLRDIAPEELRNPLDVMNNTIFEYIRQLRHNRIAQTYTETVLGTPDWGKTVKREQPPIPIQEWERGSPKIAAIKRDPSVYVYNNNGMMHSFRAADSELARAMRFNPSSVMMGFNQLRKLSQTFFTGPLAPFFAPVAAELELGVLRAKLPSHYVKGPLDALMKRVFPSSPLGRTFDFGRDPTTRLWQLSGFLEQISAPAIDALATTFGKRMDNMSNLIQLSGTGKQMAEAGIREVNNIRTRYQFLREHVITPPHEDVIQYNEGAYRMASSILRGTPLQKTMPVMRVLKRGYLGLLDAIRNSAKYGLAAQNIELLIRKHGGFNNIPPEELHAFINDFRHISGDMTQAIGNPLVANIASVIPYGQTWINSTVHMFSGAREHPVYVASRIFSNMIAPKMFWVAALTYLMTKPDGTNDFVNEFWDNMPSWQRWSIIPMLSPKYIAEVTSNGYRQPTMDDVTYMRQAPEAVPYAEVFMSMARAAGWFGTHAKDTATWRDMLGAIVASLPTPDIPIIDVAMAFKTNTETSKYQGPGMTGDSDGMRMFHDAMSAMFGSTADIVDAGLNAASDSLDRSRGIGDALSKAVGYPTELLKQKMPEMLSPLFGNQRRHYTKGQVRDRNLANFKLIGNIQDQLSEQNKDNKGRMGPYALPSVTDPNVLRMMREMNAYASRGAMNALTKQRSALYSQIERLDANRGQITPSEYTRMTEQLKQEINDIDRQEAEIFDRLNTRLKSAYGDLGVTDIPSAYKYIHSQLNP